MRTVGEEFIYLETDAQAIPSTGLLTRALNHVIGEEPILVGLDASGQRHLLVPSLGAAVPDDAASRGVALGRRRLRLDGKDVDYLDVVCRIKSLDLVFERLLDDLLGRLTMDGSTPMSTVRATLDEWRALLRSAGQPLDRETVVGLVGELEVLARMAEHDPAGALDRWRGPTMAVHDFVKAGWELEVKTTTSVDGNFVTVSNLDQLDPALVGELHLVVVHARDDETAPSLDERMDALALRGVPRDELVRRVESAGYVYESDPSAGRLAVRSVRAWEVEESFPGLRGSDLDERRKKGVSKVRFDLALDAAPPRLTDEQFAELVARWAGP